MNDNKVDKEKIDRIKKYFERNRTPGTFERYNIDILQYLHNKFPDEPVSSIQEAAAYISNRTCVVVMDMQVERLS